MYVEDTHQALKTHLMAIRVNKLLVFFFFKNQSAGVIYLLFYISSIILLFQKLFILCLMSSDQCIDDMPNVLYLHFHALSAYQTWHERQLLKDISVVLEKKKEDGKM